MSKIKLYFRYGFSIFNYSYDILPDYLSGASCLNAKFIRSIYSFFGSTRSKIRAIIVESIPPENNTAILGPLISLYELYGECYFFIYFGFLPFSCFPDLKSISLMHFVSYFTLSIRSFLQFFSIYSSNWFKFF